MEPLEETLFTPVAKRAEAPVPQGNNWTVLITLEAADGREPLELIVVFDDQVAARQFTSDFNARKTVFAPDGPPVHPPGWVAHYIVIRRGNGGQPTVLGEMPLEPLETAPTAPERVF